MRKVRVLDPADSHSSREFLLRFALAVAFVLVLANQAAAQYGGGGGMGGGSTGSGGSTGTGTYSAPKGGYSSSTGIAAGAGAAAGAGILFLALRHHGQVTGCVQPAEDGLRLVDEKKNTSYALLPGDVYLKSGQRVQLKGHKSKSELGAQSFQPAKLVKDLGSCDASSSANAAPPAAH